MQQMVIESVADGCVCYMGKTLVSIMVQILHHYNPSTSPTTELVTALNAKIEFSFVNDPHTLCEVDSVTISTIAF